MIGFWLSAGKNAIVFFSNIVTFNTRKGINPLSIRKRVFNKYKNWYQLGRSFNSNRPFLRFWTYLLRYFIYFYFLLSLLLLLLLFIIHFCYLPYLFITDFSFTKGSLTIITLNSDGLPDKENTFALFFPFFSIIPQGSIPPSRRLKDVRIPYKKNLPLKKHINIYIYKGNNPQQRFLFHPLTIKTSSCQSSFTWPLFFFIIFLFLCFPTGFFHYVFWIWLV